MALALASLQSPANRASSQLSLLEMNSLDWMAYGIVFFVIGGILAGFFFYLRTAYKVGGWKRVGRDFLVAIVALAVWGLIRIFQNQEIDELKDAVDHWFK